VSVGVEPAHVAALLARSTADADGGGRPQPAPAWSTYNDTRVFEGTSVVNLHHTRVSRGVLFPVYNAYCASRLELSLPLCTLYLMHV
jgi:hypothetical protein